MDTMPSTSGIYLIRNTVNGNRYIGSAVNIAKRWYEHRHRLKAGRHSNRHLQSAYRLYGAEAFCYEVLEYVSDVANLTGREQHHIDALRPEYNIAPIAGNQLGMKHSLETLAKISNASSARTGWHHSEEAKKNMSAAAKQRCTPEWRARQSAMVRQQWTPDSSAPHVVTIRARKAEKLSQKTPGPGRKPPQRRLSPEEWKAMVERTAQKRRGKGFSDVAVANMTQAQRRRFARPDGAKRDPETGRFIKKP